MNIYHYTSMEGALGIIGSGSIWATHIAYLNDLTEFVYLKQLIQNSSQGYYSSKYNIVNILEDIGKSFDVYTCSFSKERNLLSQWRSYTPTEGGVTIGFDENELERNGFKLFPCLYEGNLFGEEYETRLSNKLEEVIEAIFDDGILSFDREQIEKLDYQDYIEDVPFDKDFEANFEKLREEEIDFEFPEPPSGLAVKLLQRRIGFKLEPFFIVSDVEKVDLGLEDRDLLIKYFVCKLCAIVKNNSFFEEDEVRAVELCRKDIDENTEFRVKNGLLLPYKKLDFSRSAIKEIVIGPGLNQKRNKLAFRMLKDKYKMDYDIKLSNIPYQE